MRIPVDIQFEGLPPSVAVKARVEEEVKKLEQFFDKIISCRVMVTKPHHSHHKGNLFEVRIFMSLPGENIVSVDKSPGRHETHEDVYVAIRDSFNAARRQLQEITQKMNRKVKSHGSGGQ